MTTKPTPAQLRAELEKALSERSFDTIEDLQAFAAQFMQAQNVRVIDDFHGLTPNQMQHVLYAPFESPEVLEVATTLVDEPQAPVVELLGRLFEAIGSEGLKATATGNLPRLFCRQAALGHWGEEKYAKRTRFGNINQELDFFELHIARVMAEDCGLIRNVRGRWQLTRRCQTMIKKTGMREIYPMVLKHHALRFNWDYAARHDTVPIIQTSCFFTLYLLTLYGQDWREHTFYTEAFVQAFPAAVELTPSTSYMSAEESLKTDYFYATLYRFASFMGLAEVQDTSEKPGRFQYRVRATPLLSQVVRFKHLMG